MSIFRVILIVVCAMSLGACSKLRGPVVPDSKLRGPVVPDVTSVVVDKSDRKMYLVSGSTVKKSYDVGLGFAPTGDKKIRGDGKTPEGAYFIDRKNYNSQFYLSVGISYPNAADIAEAKALGKSAGGDIFVHGRSGDRWRKMQDWTAGCIAVTNKEMREIYQSVAIGTPIFIRP